MESKWPNDNEGQGQWPPFSLPAEGIPRCICGTNLVIIAQMHQKLLCGQTKFPRILSENAKITSEGQSQWSPFSIPAESIPRCMFGANLVILAQVCDKLSCRQGKVYESLKTQGVKIDNPYLIHGGEIGCCFFSFKVWSKFYVHCGSFIVSSVAVINF